MTDTVQCHCCGGSGRIELTGVAAETLALLRGQREPINGASLAQLYGCTNEAMCNRLRVLEEYGFATSRRYGVSRLWTATNYTTIGRKPGGVAKLSGRTTTRVATREEGARRVVGGAR